MRKRWTRYAGGVALLQGALLLTACEQAATPTANNVTVQPAESPATPVSGPERLVVAFGDSVYAGYGLPASESLPDDLQDALRARGLNARVVGAGVSGDTTAGGRRRLAFVLDELPRKPDLVVLGLGGNDVLRQIPPEEARANLMAMMDELRRREIAVVLTGMVAPPNLGPDYAGAFNRIYPDLAKEYGATLDPFILQGVIGDRRLMLPDGIHPNAQGVDRIVARIAPLAAERLGQS